MGVLALIVMVRWIVFKYVATYDLTNLATLKNWPTGVSLLDMAWGVVVSVASASAGKAALDRFTTG